MTQPTTAAPPDAPATAAPGSSTGLVLGIVGLFIPVLSPLAIWMGVKGRGTGGGRSTAAIVLGVIGTIWLVVIVVSLATHGVHIHTS